MLSSIRLAAVIFALAGQAQAGACDYTFSRLAGRTTSALTGGKGLTGEGIQTLGYYTLAHAGAGIKMIGATVSAAETGGIASAVGSILMAPATLAVGGIAIIGIGSFEGYCYFQVKRITDPYAVREIIESIAFHDEAVSIVQTKDGLAMALEAGGKTKTYLLRQLYIADGQLKHRDFMMNTNLGPVAFTSKELSE